MRRTALTALALVVTLGASAAAQNKEAKQAGAPKPAAKAAAKAITWSDLVGDWNGKSMKGKTDSVITTVTTTYHPDKTITMTFPNRKPVAAKMIAMGGDSVVIETDKYESITRPGHMTTVRMVSHYGDHKMWGTFTAKFDDGKSLDGTTTAAHKMK